MYPFVLAHGIAPFDELYRPCLIGPRRLCARLGQDPDRFDYFRGIASHLRRNGFTVFAPRVDFAAGVERRAKELAGHVAGILEATNASKVHVIAHSMGGLDARHMIVDEGMAERIATLTTIGTPHLGTSLVDAEMERVAGGLVDFLPSAACG